MPATAQEFLQLSSAPSKDAPWAAEVSHCIHLLPPTETNESLGALVSSEDPIKVNIVDLSESYVQAVVAETGQATIFPLHPVRFSQVVIPEGQKYGRTEYFLRVASVMITGSTGPTTHI